MAIVLVSIILFLVGCLLQKHFGFDSTAENAPSNTYKSTNYNNSRGSSNALGTDPRWLAVHIAAKLSGLSAATVHTRLLNGQNRFLSTRTGHFEDCVISSDSHGYSVTFTLRISEPVPDHPLVQIECSDLCGDDKDMRYSSIWMIASRWLDKISMAGCPNVRPNATHGPQETLWLMDSQCIFDASTAPSREAAVSILVDAIGKFATGISNKFEIAGCRFLPSIASVENKRRS